ncbi:N-acetyl-gamma-glutamyl-phosphate reductase [Comamonas sp. E6]|nr:N-acetyl-gamma-glutamyl-phosphate reductase [Comamonas sp. E6]
MHSDHSEALRADLAIYRLRQDERTSQLGTLLTDFSPHLKAIYFTIAHRPLPRQVQRT